MAWKSAMVNICSACGRTIKKGEKKHFAGDCHPSLKGKKYWACDECYNNPCLFFPGKPVEIPRRFQQLDLCMNYQSGGFIWKMNPQKKKTRKRMETYAAKRSERDTW